MIDNMLSAIRNLADLLLPRKCIVCCEKLTVREEHICRWCRDDMPLTRFWQIRHNPMADKFNAALQKELERQWDAGTFCTERYTFAAALFFFSEEADYKNIPYRIKYEGDIRAGKHFGEILGRHLNTAEWFRDVDFIIPVPLHWRRKWKRGYNQAEIIAQGVSDALGAPVRADILKRTKHTRTQVNIDIQQKAANVEGAFSVNTGTAVWSTGCGIRHILLIDDVFTTGSTLMACFTALRTVFPPGVKISVATLGFVGGG